MLAGKISGMKKSFFRLLFLTLLAVAALGLTATAGYAQVVYPCPPNKTGAMWTAMSNYSDAMRVRDRSYERQIIKQNDSTLGLSCFDAALGLSAKLGLIFSDLAGGLDLSSLIPRCSLSASVSASLASCSISASLSGSCSGLPTGIPAMLKNVFTGTIAFPTLGLGDILAQDLKDILEGVLRAMLNNFQDALGFTLYGPGPDFMKSIMDFLNDILGPLTTVINDIYGLLGQINQIVGWFQTIAQVLNCVLPMISPAYAEAILAVVEAAMSAVKALLDAVSQLITQFVNIFMGILKGLLTGISFKCDIFQALWNKNGTASAGGAQVQLKGLEQGTPYFDIQSFLSGSPSGAGSALSAELGVGANPAILTKAQADLTGSLSAPGSMPGWQAPPTFAATASTCDVIKGIKPSYVCP